MNLHQTNPFAYFEFDEQICNLYRSGGFYSDSEFNKISLKEHPGFSDYETNLATRHPGYRVLRGNGLLVPEKPETINLKTYVKETLLAKEGTASLFEGKLLDGSDLECKVAYTSYSRSGNTLFRKLLE